MRIVTANGKKTVKMSKTEWTEIGKKAGWKTSSVAEHEEDKNVLNTIRDQFKGTKYYDRFKVGEKALITGGGFENFEGEIKSVVDDYMALVLVYAFGKPVEIQVPFEFLTKDIDELKSKEFNYMVRKNMPYDSNFNQDGREGSGGI